MPIYLFSHVKTGEVHEVVFHMNDDKVYAGPKGDQKGQWKREWTKPRAMVDTKVDPYSAKDFVKATGKGGCVGDLWDRAKELSLKRQDKDGTDPVRQAYFDRYSKRRHGKKHPEQQREESVKTLAAKGIKVDWGNDD
jgi:predicted nucleic acid-binding Zn ribbon protein